MNLPAYGAFSTDSSVINRSCKDQIRKTIKDIEDLNSTANQFDLTDKYTHVCKKRCTLQ